MRKRVERKPRPAWLAPVLTGALLALAVAGGTVAYAAHLENHDGFCASCHTQPESKYYDRSLAAPMDLASAHAAKDVTCIQCHSGVEANRDFNNHFHAFLPLWQARAGRQAATCVDCHSSHVPGGDPQTAFLSQSTTVAVCQRCHAFAGG